MKNTVILLHKQVLGTVAESDLEFGREMLDKFLHTLESQPEKPLAICFFTEGVKLVVRDSPLLLGLKLLQSQGVRMVICQSCLERYGLRDDVAVGEVGGMPDIVKLISAADKVVTV
ncbi:MAG: DsrE family protein [Pirellulaceae bacterium]|nr:DsrE family protein [Pirellulaceae bacterium]